MSEEGAEQVAEWGLGGLINTDAYPAPSRTVFTMATGCRRVGLALQGRAEGADSCPPPCGFEVYLPLALALYMLAFRNFYFDAILDTLSTNSNDFPPIDRSVVLTGSILRP